MPIYLPADIPAEWRELLLLIPGYDAIATAGDAFFDSDAAQLSLDFFPQCLTHVEGTLFKKPFVLQPWQKAIVANLFGWKRKDDEGRIVRRYREALIYVPRKNGKSPLVAGIALLVFFTDAERGQQGFIAASEKKQAGKLYRHCKGMIDAQKALSRQCKMYGGNAPAGQAKSITRESDNSFLQVVSADEAGAHGDNPNLIIVDELHTQPNRGLIDTFQSSFKSCNRAQPLFICISTADYDRPSICNEKVDYARKIRDGSMAIAKGTDPDDPTIAHNPKFLPVIYEADRAKDKWDDEAVWARVNPNLGVSVSLEALRDECKLAKQVPATLNNFLRLGLNMRTNTNQTCIPVHQWDACKRDIDFDFLKGRDCFAALDLGATSDFCALARLFPHDDAEIIEVAGDPVEGQESTRTVIRQTYSLLMDFWLPERPVRRDSRMQKIIEQWIEEKLIHVTPGDAVDYPCMLEDILKLLEPYSLVDMALDRAFEGLWIGSALKDNYGDKVFNFPQGILSMAAPFRELVELLPAQRLHHEGHQVMRWMIGNVVPETGPHELIKPSKKKSTEKIDGVTALTMAIGRVQFHAANGPRSCYDNRGVLTI